MPEAVYIHIGLHKTATRFLQRAVFKHLDSSLFNHNPQPFTDALYRYIRNPTDQGLKDRFNREIERVLQDKRRLLISLPDISGDMYNSHENAAANLAILKEKFPQAKILYMVRDQAGWLLSAYRQSIQKGAFGPIEVFLNFYDGAFRPKIAQRMGGMRNVDALGLKFLDIYQRYAAAYGAENVLLLRYADFRTHRQAVERRLAQWLDIDHLPPSLENEKQHNRSFSALAITLFCGSLHAPKHPPKASPAKKEWQKKYSPMRIVRNLKRIFIRHIFDRIIYKDWDLLARNGMRQLIEDHYQEENKVIAQHARVDG